MILNSTPGRCGGLMVSALDSGLSGPGSSPGRGHCVVFLGKTLYSYSASLHPGVQMGTSKYAGGNPAMDQHPIQGEQQYSQLLHAKETRVERQPHGPCGPVWRLYFLLYLTLYTLTSVCMLSELFSINFSCTCRRIHLTMKSFLSLQLFPLF